MANWVIRCSERYLSPFYFRLHELLLEYDVLQQEKLPLRSQKTAARPTQQQEFYVGIPFREISYRLGEHSLWILKNPKVEHPQKFLEGFHGVCEYDAYAVYKKMDRENPDITFAFCHAHARRYFAEVLKAIPKGQRDKAKGMVAHEALERIAGI